MTTPPTPLPPLSEERLSDAALDAIAAGQYTWLAQGKAVNMARELIARRAEATRPTWLDADSYNMCPRCKAADPFLDADDEDNWTLREWHEFYLALDGTFTADYQGKCDECDFEFAFNHKQQVQVRDGR